MKTASNPVEASLEGLSQDRAELLKLLLERKASQSDPVSDHQSAARGGDLKQLPTSWAQQRLWFLNQFKGANLAYHMSIAARLTGDLDTDPLRSALNTVLSRHDILRMTFAEAGGVPIQVDGKHTDFSLLEVDLRVHENPDLELLIQTHKVDEAQSEFDLNAGPLIRGRLLRLADDAYLLLITMHHIITDGWSVTVLLRELADLYTAYTQGRENPLQPLPIQYDDYVRWQFQRFKGDRLNAQLNYWREVLKDAPPQIQLPTDRTRPDIQTYRGETLSVNLDSTLGAQLTEFAKRHGVTLFMLLCSAWAILLSRISGQNDILIGTPAANRQREEFEDLIGFFVNTLVIRLTVTGTSRVKDLLEQVKERTLSAYEHQDVPFEKVVEAIQPERALSRNPVFQVMLAFQNAPKTALRLPGVTVTLEDTQMPASLFDLSLFLEERDKGISGVVNYATDLFDRETVQRWMRSFDVLLRGILDDVSSRIEHLPILSGNEHHLICNTFNATDAPDLHANLIHELFEQQVRITPKGIAVVYNDQRWTYAELEIRANHLAQYLRTLGIGHHHLVGLYVERGLEMIVGLLGVLKSGAAYVPLDPEYPAERTMYILKDSAPAVLLTQQSLEPTLRTIGPPKICLDRDWDQIVQTSVDAGNLEGCTPSPHDLAYVIYTSGSTGNPKGVMVTHRGVVNLLNSMLQLTGLAATDSLLAVTTLAFDIAALELYLPLTCGARVVVADRKTVVDPTALGQMIADQHITVMQATPATWRMLVDSNWPGVPRIKALCGGEALSTELAFQLRQQVDQLWNVYGPTETTIWSTVQEIRDEQFTHQLSSIQSLGKPIANTQVYVLDNSQHLAPIGVVGEVYIGGHGLARGYLNRPELTSERFICNPFSPHSGTRLYRSGDLGRWRLDGTLEYVGRNDHQVKIRGYRIELAEIEAEIVRHTHVKEAVVLAREDVPGDKRLVAYVVGEPDAGRNADSGGTADKIRTTVVGEWERIWKETYTTEQAVRGPSFAGWNSSYTGEPIPETEMQEWLDWTIARIQKLEPTAILEIGCGVGLLLQRLAPKCVRYVGTDLSASALDALRHWADQRTDLKHVELIHRSASELDNLEPGSFDTVVLNSVVQYFPDVEYLICVLRTAVRLLRSGGKIFLGDIRHLGLLQVFQSAVQLSRAGATVNTRELRNQVSRTIAQEKELLFEPEFFQGLPAYLPEISSVDIELKRGWSSNELTRHRYDVVLHIRGKIGSKPICESLDWQSSAMNISSLGLYLRERRWLATRFTSIPNARLTGEMQAKHWIATVDDTTEASQLRRQLQELPVADTNPEVLCELGAAHSYDVRIAWSPGQANGAFDAEFVDRMRANQVTWETLRPPESVKSLAAYANNPMYTTFAQQLSSELREYVARKLPEYMIPSTWMLIHRLPRTPNGKIDRRALPAPQSRSNEVGEYVAPATELEHTLASIWSDVLRVDRVGITDDFFGLGGHSLLGIKLIAQIAERLGVHLSVISVFHYPTIAKMATALNSQDITDSGRTSKPVEFEEGII